MATIDAMRWAGIEPEMKVLDIGSETGAVAFEAARLVGPTGSVLGLDIGDVPVQSANERAVRLGLGNVSCHPADRQVDGDPLFQCTHDWVLADIGTLEDRCARPTTKNPESWPRCWSARGRERRTKK
jgi:tRNA A58 N-methylase Trm61